MKALEFGRKPIRFAAAKAAATVLSGSGVQVGPLRLRELEMQDPPTADWQLVRPLLSGICGSDLATLDSATSRWFEPVVSFPFVPGHEVVCELEDGHRAVLQPVLSCATRNIEPMCTPCRDGRIGNCENVTFGTLEPGIQTGSCCDTGGGWSEAFWAHPTQLHPVPDQLSDEAAVMVEPTACAIHAVLQSQVQPDSLVVVIGAGTLGLLTVAALNRYAEARIMVVAKHPEQRRLASSLGADIVVAPGELRRAVRRHTHSGAIGDGAVERVGGGADTVIDCVGSATTLCDAIDVTRPRGHITLVGMPGRVDVDLAGLWQREITLGGAYTYGSEQTADGPVDHTFELAFDLVDHADLGRLVSAAYPLDRYVAAIDHAAHAGARGAVKIAFDLRGGRRSSDTNQSPEK
jgi:threonine dehydrogenase-like Zn-dependent dehydrogenase